MKTKAESRILKPWRLIGWGSAALLLLMPLIAMQFTQEVNWTGSDFAVFGAMLAVAGGLFEVAVRISRHRAYRAAAALALFAAFLMFWANAAVGIIGNENNPANRLFEGLLLLGFLGALIVQFRAAGMVWVMRGMALGQVVICIGAAVSGAGLVYVFTGVYVAIWLGSAWLFRRAAEQAAVAEVGAGSA